MSSISPGSGRDRMRSTDCRGGVDLRSPDRLDPLKEPGDGSLLGPGVDGPSFVIDLLPERHDEGLRFVFRHQAPDPVVLGTEGSGSKEHCGPMTPLDDPDHHVRIQATVDGSVLIDLAIVPEQVRASFPLPWCDQYHPVRILEVEFLLESSKEGIVFPGGQHQVAQTSAADIAASQALVLDHGDRASVNGCRIKKPSLNSPNGAIGVTSHGRRLPDRDGIPSRERFPGTTHPARDQRGSRGLAGRFPHPPYGRRRSTSRSRKTGMGSLVREQTPGTTGDETMVPSPSPPAPRPASPS